MRQSPDPSRKSEIPKRTAVSVAEARELILASLPALGVETVGLREATDRVLAEDIAAERLIPPRDNSAMDGYALRAEDATDAPARLAIVEEIAAGHDPQRKLGPGEAARILTGAAVPEGADAVVMQEQTRRDGSEVILEESVSEGQHIRRAGSDVRPGTQVLAKGRGLRAADIGMLAALGRTQISVVTRARVAILATGDELVEPDRLRDDGRIVASNSYALQAALLEAGAEPVLLGISRDEPELIAEAFRRALRCDAVISTGGVSVGDRDWIKQVLAELGGDMRLWRVRMKPGAPLAYVVLDGRPVFGLPGNPVSSLVTFEQFVRPALLTMMGHTDVFRPVERAQLSEDYRKPAGRAHFVRVRVHSREGRLHATPTGDQSSGVLLSMVQANGLVFVPEDETWLRAGGEVPVIMLRRDDLRPEPGY